MNNKVTKSINKKILRILTLNSGSSSLKFSLFHMGESEQLELSGNLERIGVKGGRFHARDGQGETLKDQHQDIPDHNAALQMLFDWLDDHTQGEHIDAVGHRVVHGGSDYRQPHAVTSELLAKLKELVPMDPDHLPHEIKAIQAVSQMYPELEQIACFDTAFHRHMPEVAQWYALPRSIWHAGVKRYGFHGLSYEYIMMELGKEAGEEAAKGRVIVAHLGNGASMAAVKAGVGIDTTMGYTPTGGLVMGTRCGDLDPGVVLYLLEERGMKASSINDMLNHYSGLMGVSGISSDMKDLLEKESQDAHAAMAVNLFCYQAKKFIGALASVLGGLDTLVFTGGIGENAAAIRARICEHMEYIGIKLDIAANERNAGVISVKEAPVTVRVMKTNEELMIARHTYKLIERDK
jgi:acetate kinase